MELWIEKYKPKRISEIADQHKAIGEVLKWIEKWKPGKEALFFYGPPGCGKTLLAEALANEKGWTLLRMNASDKRTAKDVESILGETSKLTPLFSSGKLILIDEVDGITGGDRGAIPAIIKLIKNSRFPIILIANDPWKPSLFSLRAYTKLVKFNKIPTPQIEKKLKLICNTEGITVHGDVLKTLARWSQGDMRSAISDLQVVSSGKRSISEKDLEILGYRERELTIFNILPTLLRSGSINASKRVIMNADKDPDEIFLWIENNLPLVVKNPENLAKSFDLLSVADIMRNRVSIQQNWRFKAIMIDLLSCISLFKDEESPGFVSFQPPKRISMLAQTKKARTEIDLLCEKIGEFVHASKRVVKKDYLPYLAIIAKKYLKPSGGLEMSKEEVSILKNLLTH